MTASILNKRNLVNLIILFVLISAMPISAGVDNSYSDAEISVFYDEGQGISYSKTVQSTYISPSQTFCPQTYNNDDELLIYGSNHYAQSFVADKGRLDSVSLKLRKIGNPSQGLTVSIYDLLTDEKMVSVYKSPDEVSGISTWVDFDFDDIKVYPGGSMWGRDYDGIGVADNSYDFLFKTIDGQGEIDQQWKRCSGFGEILFSDDIYYAQSFSPTTSKISKLVLALGRRGNPSDLIVSVMRSLDGEELTKVSIPSEDVPYEGWIEIDCDDITVIPGQTYYIVCRTTAGDGDTNYYAWWFGYNDDGQQEEYTRGERWTSYDSGKYYIVCETTGGNSENCYAWAVESHDNSYNKGACYKSENSGFDWEEQIYDDMFFRLVEKDAGDKIDQLQHVYSGSGRRIFDDMMTAQSFISTGKNISKVRLLMFANIPPNKDIKVSIRKDLDGADLTSVSRPASDFYYFDGCPHWYEFDFEDIKIKQGETYYIVCISPQSDGSHDYAWGHMMSQSTDYYNNGAAFYTYDGGKNWVENDDFGITDHCFETYYCVSGESDSSPKSSLKLFKFLDFFPVLQQFFEFFSQHI